MTILGNCDCEKHSFVDNNSRQQTTIHSTRSIMMKIMLILVILDVSFLLKLHKECDMHSFDMQIGNQNDKLESLIT